MDGIDGCAERPWPCGALRCPIVSQYAAHAGSDVLRQLRSHRPASSIGTALPWRRQTRHSRTRVRTVTGVLRCSEWTEYDTRSPAVCGYENVPGRAADEAGPDEHGRIDRKPRPVS